MDVPYKRQRTPAGTERVSVLPLNGAPKNVAGLPPDRFASLSWPDDMTFSECAYFSAQLRSLATGFESMGAASKAAKTGA